MEFYIYFSIFETSQYDKENKINTNFLYAENAFNSTEICISFQRR